MAGSKTLHHLLPDLVPPIDREYTRPFFGLHNPEFGNSRQPISGMRRDPAVCVAPGDGKPFRAAHSAPDRRRWRCCRHQFGGLVELAIEGDRLAPAYESSHDNDCLFQGADAGAGREAGLAEGVDFLPCPFAPSPRMVRPPQCSDS